MQELPAEAGIELANWNWKVVHRFVWERWGVSLSRSGCLNYLHRLGFVLKRPKKRLVKADEQKRESFVAEYAARWDEAHRAGARIFFADEAHFRADAELRGKWMPQGRAGLGGLQQPTLWREGQLLLGGVPGDGRGGMDGTGGQTANSGTSAAFLDRLRQKHSGPLDVIWDNAPAHRGEAVREYLRTPGLELRLVNLPGYSPDFNADEAIWGWVREEATGNLCLGTKSLVKERVGNFLASLASRKEEVKRRCRTVLQSRAEGLLQDSPAPFPTHGKCTSHLGFGLVSNGSSPLHVETMSKWKFWVTRAIRPLGAALEQTRALRITALMKRSYRWAQKRGSLDDQYRPNAIFGRQSVRHCRGMA